jgi:acetylornithine/succinyldiaminopimelate/putrescine aminotransferase
MSPKKYPYNNRIISIEGTFLGDTLYSLSVMNGSHNKGGHPVLNPVF